MAQGALFQHTHEHRCIKAHGTVRRQQHRELERAEEGDEGSESLVQWDGVYWSPFEIQGAIADREPCDLFGAVSELTARENVGIEGLFSTDC